VITSKRDSPRRFASVVLAALLGAGLVVAALRGGSYAPVPRQELFVLVLWVLAGAMLLGLLPRYTPARGAVVAVAALTVLAAWAAVGVVWTESDGQTMAEVARTVGFAGMLLLVTLSFGGRDWQTAVGFVTVAALTICVLSFVSRLAPDLLPSALASNELYRRLGYPLNYWNALASWAAMAAVMSLSITSTGRSRWACGAALAGTCVAISVIYLTYSRAGAIAIFLATATVVALGPHRWQTTFNAAFATVGSAAIIASIRAHPDIASGRGSRGAMVVAAVALAVAAACMLAGRAGLTDRLRGRRLAPRTARIALTTVAVVGAVSAVAAGPYLADRAWTSFSARSERRGTVDPAERLGNLSGIRQSLWRASLHAFDAHPLHGTGAGTFEYVWNRDPHRDTPVRDAHSLYVEVLGELGILGAVAALVAFGSLLTSAVRATLRQTDPSAAGAAAGCTGAFVVFCFTAGLDWIWEVTAAASLGIVCGGLASAAGTTRAAPLRALPRVAGTVLVLVWLAIQLPVLVGEAQVRASREAIRRDDFDGALSHATTAIEAQPWAARGYLQRAVVLERTGYLREAAADARRSTEKERTNWETWLTLARIEAERGRVPAALRAARRARALNPHSPLFAP
jgi:hypothetical protein